MKILMVSTAFPPVFGGGAIQATYLSGELIRQGVDVEFITDGCNKPSKHDVYNGIKIFRCWTLSSKYSSKIGELIFVLRILWYVLCKKEFKIVHFHSIRGLEALFFPLLKLMNKKIVLKLTLMGVDDPLTFKNRKKIGFLYIWGLKFVDKFIAISTGLKEQAIEAGIQPNKVEIIFNGVDTVRFRKLKKIETNIFKKNLQLNRYKTVFLSIGRIEHRKGYDFLLKSWVEMRKNFDSPILLLIGPANENSNPYYCSLMKYINEQKLDDVRFLGEIKKVEQYFQISNCFVFCSKAEGFGTVLIEAMASSVPVVATNIVGVTEDIIKNKKIGRICYSQSPEKFSRIVKELLQENNMQEKEAAVQEVKTKFSIIAIAQQYQILYKDLLN